jgi:hypothetical protein
MIQKNEVQIATPTSSRRLPSRFGIPAKCHQLPTHPCIRFQHDLRQKPEVFDVRTLRKQHQQTLGLESTTKLGKSLAICSDDLGALECAKEEFCGTFGLADGLECLQFEFLDLGDISPADHCYGRDQGFLGARMQV